MARSSCPAPSGVVDPRPDPTGEYVAFLSGPAYTWSPPPVTSPISSLAEEQGPAAAGDVTWGAAEFIAAEEMARSRGFWWSPDGRSLLAARVDNGPVATWWTADPSQPADRTTAAPLPCRRYRRRARQPLAPGGVPGGRAAQAGHLG